ncbi:MAG TPA: cyclase family protein [Bacteroidia bacterium]|nr:cyclase family protein [Bacteroidia bacterium]HNT80949.1 cyclase family protein [Bacteroidia bacterium]
MNKKRIDLSHSITDGLITYKGLPAPIICDYLSREDSKKFYPEGTSFQIGRINMIANTGTYLDCPFHRYEQGADLSELLLEQVSGLDAVCIQFDYEKNGLSIEPKHIEQINLKGKAVLLHTGWSKHWNTDKYFEQHPFLSEAAALYLQQQNVALVGIDSHNIDDTRGNSRPAHSILLGNNILIVEHMTQLHLLPSSGFDFYAVPPKVQGMGTFPVRAFAELK